MGDARDRRPVQGRARHSVLVSCALQACASAASSLRLRSFPLGGASIVWDYLAEDPALGISGPSRVSKPPSDVSSEG